MPQNRRQSIKSILRDSQEPIKGSQLSELLGVSRQVIVQDIALLRAEGEDIIATPQGYIFIKRNYNGPQKHLRVFTCQHDYQGMGNELRLIVGQGGKVVDVIVEHPLYGELRVNLMLEKLEDVEHFLGSLTQSGAEPLSVLTKGIHLHTIEAHSLTVLDKIEQELQQAGFLQSSDS